MADEGGPRVLMVGLPVYTLARFSGLGLSPSTLRKAGIAAVVSKNSRSFRDLGDVRLPVITSDAGDPRFKNRNLYIFATKIIKKACGAPFREDFVVNLGGECSLMPGVLAGLSCHFTGGPGVVWMDAHGDFNTLATTPSGYIGGMALALACGRDRSYLADAGLEAPPVQEERLAHLGSRALDREEEKAMQDSPMFLRTASQLRKTSPEEAAASAARFVADRADWVVAHLDVDFLDPTVISAVNFPERGGMTLSHVTTIARALRRTGKLRVLNLTAYNPEMDKTGKCANLIAKLAGEFLKP